MNGREKKRKLILCSSLFNPP